MGARASSRPKASPTAAQAGQQQSFLVTFHYRRCRRCRRFSAVRASSWWRSGAWSAQAPHTSRTGPDTTTLSACVCVCVPRAYSTADCSLSGTDLVDESVAADWFTKYDTAGIHYYKCSGGCIRLQVAAGGGGSEIRAGAWLSGAHRQWRLVRSVRGLGHMMRPRLSTHDIALASRCVHAAASCSCFGRQHLPGLSGVRQSGCCTRPECASCTALLLAAVRHMAIRAMP